MTNTDGPSVLNSALLDKSNVMGAHAFREMLMSHLPDDIKYIFWGLVVSCQMIKCLRYTLRLQQKKKCSPKVKLIWVALQPSNIILIRGVLYLSNRE